MPRPDRANRSPRYRLYRANGGLLPYDVWLKHHQSGYSAGRAARQQHDAITLPPSWFVAVVIGGLSAGVTLVVVGRAAGWW